MNQTGKQKALERKRKKAEQRKLKSKKRHGPVVLGSQVVNRFMTGAGSD